MKNIILCVIALFLFSSSLYANKPASLVGKAEKASFKLFKNETNLGTIAYEIDKQGNYQRVFDLQFAGQVITYKFSVHVDDSGLWKSMIIDTPGQKIDVIREDSNAKFVVDGKTITVPLTNNHVLYDSYGPVFESFTLKKYDLSIGGKQKISRFFVPSTCADVTVEYIGEETRTLSSGVLQLKQFNIDVMGIMLHVFVDSNFDVYLIKVPVQYATYVRSGYEELLKPKEKDNSISSATAIVKKEAMMVPMRDGIKLGTDLYFPENKDKKYPVILIRTPYKKEMLEVVGNYYATREYVVAIQDCRGRFSSEGEWEPFVNEANDGYDAVEWLAIKDWSNGKVGMIGGSYVGWTQLWAAATKPPHLVTIIPNVAPPDPFYNIPYEYGAFYLFLSMWWTQILEENATADASGQTMQKINNVDKSAFESLPVIDLDKKIMKKENPYWRKWIKNNVNTGYWEQSNFMEKLQDLEIPVFLQSGWFDGDGIGSKLNYSYLKKSKNKYQKLIIGPWGHTDESSSSVGDMKFGDQAVIDLQKLYLRWFDKWLKGIDNKIDEEPLVKIFVMYSNKWLEADTYPLPQTNFTPLYLSSKKGANTSLGDGLLSFEIEQDGHEFDEYTYDPGDPTPFPEFVTYFSKPDTNSESDTELEADESGTNTESDTELEVDKPDTNSESDTESEADKSGTNIESDTESEADKSGTELEADKSGTELEADKSGTELEADKSGTELEADKSGTNIESDTELEADKSGTNSESDTKGEASLEKSIVETRKDILVYTTDVLEEDLTIAGPVSAKIFAASSAKDTDWCVSLLDIDENGKENKLIRGIIRARFRESTKEEKFLEENKIYEYDIDMWQTGITFKKGHRIRIEVASALFPLFSRNLNTGGHNEMDTEYVVANQKIYHSEEYPSQVILPVVKID